MNDESDFDHDDILSEPTSTHIHHYICIISVIISFILLQRREEIKERLSRLPPMPDFVDEQGLIDILSELIIVDKESTERSIFVLISIVHISVYHLCFFFVLLFTSMHEYPDI